MPKVPKMPDGMPDDLGGFGGGDGDGYDDDPSYYGQFGFGGPATLADLFTNMGLILQRGFGPLFVVWFGFGLLSCFCQCPGWLIATPFADTAGLGYDVVQFAPLVIRVLAGLLTLVIVATLASMFMPMRTYMVAGPFAISGLKPAVTKGLPKIPGVLVFLIIGGLLSAIGLVLLIIPGLLIGALFTLASYLYVTYDQTLPDSLKEALRMAQSNTGILGVAVGITFVVALLSGGLSWGCISAISYLESYWGSLYFGLGFFVIQFFTLLVMTVLWAATCITIETADTGIRVLTDEDIAQIEAEYLAY
ncbi:MAG: hypothetical protein CMH57_11300 [Myxococcales bacterium]|nr:hypothetical protein [Myxococcales bacterium]